MERPSRTTRDFSLLFNKLKHNCRRYFTTPQSYTYVYMQYATEVTTRKLPVAIPYEIYTAKAMAEPRLISMGFAPLLIFSKPSLANARARIVAAVVPSPASSFVLFATSCTSLAPMFWYLSFSSIALATVTPSFVIFGLPQLCSRITFRPWNKHRTSHEITSMHALGH